MSDVIFPAPGHDHEACVARSIERAKEAFQKRGGRLTSLREAVLRELAASHRSLGAYDIMHRLGERGRQVAPISVYRVLDSLMEAGVIHRLESANAFLACHSEHDGPHRPVLFLVCEKCGTVVESSSKDAARALEKVAAAAGFNVTGSVHEARGLCEHCVE